jgi:membrane protease subunit (stomatin/prohibitin family)
MGLGGGGVGGGGLVAARAGMRMRTRQQYRTVSRMQRRRSYIADRMGTAEEAEAQAPAQEAAPAQADYTAELEKLAKLRDQGVISAEDFEAKKQQLLGI